MLTNWIRARTKPCKTLRREIERRGTRNSSRCYGNYKTIKKPKIILKPKSSMWKWRSCTLICHPGIRHLIILSSFKQRFKSLIEQYELRELHFHSLLRTKELEVQYNMARFEEKRKAAEAEMSRSRSLNTQVLTFSKTETELRNQLNIYVEKFKQVCHLHGVIRYNTKAKY